MASRGYLQGGSLEKLAHCHRCQGRNTERTGLVDDGSAIIYCGWCFDCRDHYGYRLRVETVWDRKGRL